MRERDNGISASYSLHDEGWPVVVIYNRATGTISLGNGQGPSALNNIKAVCAIVERWRLERAPSADAARALCRQLGDWLVGKANGIVAN